MSVRNPHLRAGVSLIELIIFLGVFAMIISVALPLFFSATENRLLQQTISVVEQNGTQMLQNTSIHVHASERIISPAPGQTGSVLVLQTGDVSTDPTIIGISSGSLVIIKHATKEPVSSPQVAITNLIFRNTSTSTTRQSVKMSFKLSRTIRLQMPHSYARLFETTFSLLPDDVTHGNSCGCLAPTCASADQYTWRVCENSLCYSATTQLECP